MRLTFIPLILLGIPLAEIAVFVMVGGEIGVLATIGLVLVAAATGIILMRIQGLSTIQQIRSVMDSGGMPNRELVHGVMILLAGILLLIPGFITDIAGLLLFIPAVRERAWHFLRSRITVASAGGPARASRSRTIDLDQDEYARRPDDDNQPNNRLRD